MKRSEQGEAASPASPSTCLHLPQPPGTEASRSRRHRCPRPSRRGPPSPALANGSAFLLPNPDGVWLDTMGCPSTQPTSSAPAPAGSGYPGWEGSWGTVRAELVRAQQDLQSAVLLFASLQRGGTPHVPSVPEFGPPHSKDAAAVCGVTCAPEEGGTAPRGLALPQPELGPPQLRWDAPCRARKMVAPGQTSGADPVEGQGRQVQHQLRPRWSKRVCSCHKLDHLEQRQDLPRCRSLCGCLSHIELVGLVARVWVMLSVGGNSCSHTAGSASFCEEKQHWTGLA